MIDPLEATFAALLTPSPASLGLVFVAGTITSIGPCVAPRYLAITALAGDGRRALAPTAAFVAGLIAAYLALGFGGGWLGSIWRYSSWLYALMSAGLLAAGCLAIAGAAPCEGGHAGHAHADGSNAGGPTARAKAIDSSDRSAGAHRRSFGAIFLLGAASAFVLSPCCTPILAAIAGASVAIGNPLLGSMLLAAFALGHALPLFFAGSLAGGARRLLRGHDAAQAPAIVSGALTLALGAYYGLLA